MTKLLICWKAFWLTLAIVVGIALLIKVIVDAINGKKYAKIIGVVLLAGSICNLLYTGFISCNFNYVLLIK